MSNHPARHPAPHCCRILLATFLVLSGGCASDSLFPSRSAELDRIHDTYEREFSGFVLPKSRGLPASAAQPSASFDDTLESISEYRRNHADDPQSRSTLAHLTVLEGMIYLQTRQFGLADLTEDDVAAARPHLQSRTGDDVRDGLFAACYSPLLTGWKITAQSQLRTADAAPLEASADRIAQVLEDTRRGRASQDADLYLATSAAIFYVWVEHIRNRPFDPQTRNALYGKGRNLIGSFLSERDRQLARSIDPGTALPAGRQRYLLWYDFLSDAIEAP